jgi:hypothetical protein
MEAIFSPEISDSLPITRRYNLRDRSLHIHGWDIQIQNTTLALMRHRDRTDIVLHRCRERAVTCDFILYKRSVAVTEGKIHNLVFWIMPAVSPVVKRWMCDADHSPPSSMQAEKTWKMEIYLHFPYVFMTQCLIKHTGLRVCGCGGIW